MNNPTFRTSPRQITLAAVLLAVTLSFSPQQSRADDLNWMIAPYLWASDVGLDLVVNNDPIIGTEVPFKEILDKLDSVFMGHFELSSDNFGAFLDTVYIGLADSAVIPFGPGGPILGDALVDTDLTMKLFELGVFYRMGSTDPGSTAFDIVGGVRLVDAEQNINIILPGPGATPVDMNIDSSETDIFIGGRIVGTLSDKWHYTVRADYAGGGTEGTVNAIGAFGYTFGQSGLFSLDLGYRYMNIELKNEDSGTTTETEITMSGPILGFIFNF
jgi:hypothetical protein